LENQQLTINDIRNGLKSPDTRVRKNSVLFLSRIDKPEVINLLTPLLEDPSEDIQKACKKIIGFLSQKYGQSKELVSQQEKQKIKSEVEGTSFDPNKLLQLIVTNDPKAKIASIMSFYGVKNEQVLATFKKFLLLETDETVTATYIKAIGTIGGTGEIEYLRKYLTHPDTRVKSNTIESLSELGAYEEIIDDILPMTENSDERLKITATQYLSRIDVDVLLSEIERILSSGSDDLKNAAIKVSMFHEVNKTLDFYKNNFDSLSSDQKNLIVNHLQKSNNKKAKELLESKGYGHKSEKNDKKLEGLGSLQDKTIFEIEDELKKEDEFYYEIGIKFLEIGEFTEAIAELNNAVKINPKHFKAWRERGKAFSGLENHDNAIYCFDKAIALSPDDLESWQCKGNALEALFKDDDAEICFNKVKYLKNKAIITAKKAEETPKVETPVKIENQPIHSSVTSEKLNPNDNKKKVNMKHCPRCKAENSHSAENCKCGYAFTIAKVGDVIDAVKNTTTKIVNSITGTSEKTKICPRCKNDNPISINKCGRCGYKYPELVSETAQLPDNVEPAKINVPKEVAKVNLSVDAQTKTCPECGYELKINEIICPECGFEILKENDIMPLVSMPKKDAVKPTKIDTQINIQVKTCPECGFETNTDIKPCPECGFEFNFSNVSTLKIKNYIEPKRIQYNFIYWTFLPDISIYVDNHKIGRLKINESIELSVDKSLLIYAKSECNYNIFKLLYSSSNSNVLEIHPIKNIFLKVGYEKFSILSNVAIIFAIFLMFFYDGMNLDHNKPDEVIFFWRIVLPIILICLPFKFSKCYVKEIDK